MQGSKPTATETFSADISLPEKLSGLGMNISVRMYATLWCPDCRRAKQFLRVRQMPFEEIDIEAHPEAEEFVKRANRAKGKVPTFDVGRRIFHCSPFDTEKLAHELGVEGGLQCRVTTRAVAAVYDHRFTAMIERRYRN